MSNMLTVKEVCERLGLGAARICDMCANGQLPNAIRSPSRRIGWRIPEESVEYAQNKPWRNKVTPQTKRCRICQTEKPIEEFRTTQKGGWRTECRVCERAQQRASYAANPERRRAQVMAWYSRNKEKALMRSRERRQANLEYYRAKYKERHKQHQEQEREYRRHRWANLTQEERDALNAKWRDYKREYQARYPRRGEVGRNWRKRYPERNAEKERRRVARKKKAPVIEKIDRLAIIARDNGTCYLCGTKPTGSDLTIDHVVPLSKGGSHTADNLRVACRRCNIRKGDRLLKEPGG